MPPTQERKHIRHYARIVLKRIRISITFFVVVVATALVYDFKRNVERVPVYQASAVILIEENSRPISPVPEPYRYGPAYIETQLDLLKTSTIIATKVLEKLGRPSDYNSALKFQKMISARIKGNLLTVSITAPDRTEAIEMTNTLAETFVEEDKLRRFGASREAIHLLAQQADAMRKQLNEAESKLQKFKEENDFVAFDVANESAAKLRELINKMILEQTRSVEMKSRLEAAPLAGPAGDGTEVSAAASASDRVQQLAAEKAIVEQQLKELAPRYKAKHPKIIALNARVNELNAQIRRVDELAVSGMKSGYEESQIQLEKLAKAVADEKKHTLDMGKKILDYEALKKDVESVKELYTLVLSRIRQADLTTEVQGNTMSIVSRAQSALPQTPDKRRTIIVALAVGLLMGIGLPIFFEYLDDTVKDPNDMENRVGLALIGTVNTFSETDGRAPGVRTLVIEEKPDSPVAEAYRSIRTNIVFAAARGKLKTMLITSAQPGEGKTTTALNVAVSMAKSGLRVLLVDSDMRRPRVHKAFEIETSPGLSTFLVGEVELDGAIRPSRIPGLDLVTCGPIPPNPAELLSSEKMKEFVNAVRERYDRVLFDSPPALAVTDAAVIGAIVDGTLMVLQAGKAKYEMALECRERMQASGSHVIGGILNNVTARLARYHYSYYYRYGYYKQT